MANIKRRSDNSYQITVSCGYDGKGKKLRKYKTVTLSDTMTERQKEKEIQKVAALFEKQVETGVYLDGGAITFEEFINQWLISYAEKRLAPSTLKSYKTRLEKRIIPALGHIKLPKLQPHHLVEFYNNLCEDGIRLDGHYKPNQNLIVLLEGFKYTDLGVSFKTFARLKSGENTRLDVAEKIAGYFDKKVGHLFTSADKSNSLSNKTVRLYHNQISAILATAVQWNVITSNPAERAKPPKAEKKQIQFYDEEQTAQLLGLLEKEPLKFKRLSILLLIPG